MLKNLTKRSFVILILILSLFSGCSPNSSQPITKKQENIIIKPKELAAETKSLLNALADLDNNYGVFEFPLNSEIKAVELYVDCYEKGKEKRKVFSKTSHISEDKSNTAMICFARNTLGKEEEWRVSFVHGSDVSTSSYTFPIKQGKTSTTHKSNEKTLELNKPVQLYALGEGESTVSLSDDMDAIDARNNDLTYIFYVKLLDK